MIFSGKLRAQDIFPFVVGHGSDRRKWKRLLIRSPVLRSTKPCEASNGGHGGAGGQRQGHPIRGRESTQLAIRVIVAASDVPQRGERDPRNAARRTQCGVSGSATIGDTHTILGTGPGTGGNSREVVQALDRDETSRREIPRPSSRETAMPPRWVGGRGGVPRWTVCARVVSQPPSR